MEVQLFKPYPKQKEFISKFIDSDDLFGCVVAPRGSGKSLLGMNMMLFWLLDNPSQKGAWVSPVYNQAKVVYDQMVKAGESLITQSNRQDLNITFINGSTLKFLSSDNPDTIRGFRFNYLILDEAAFIRELTVTQSILPTLNPTGKKCLFISTPKGRNHFYDWYMKPEVVSMKFPLTECPYINQDLIDEAKKSLPPDIFKQEYMGEFVDSVNDVFTNISAVATIGMFSLERKVDAYVGIDTGLTDDMSVLTLISPTGRVLWVEATNNKPINDIAEQFMSIMGNFNIVGGYIETNGVGRAMFDLVTRSFRKVKPFNTTQDSKTDMVRKLINDIETATVELPSEDLVPELHREFSTYTYKLSTTGKLTFSHIPGAHDDYIDSLLMANYSRNQFMERRPIRISGGSMSSIKPRFT